MAKKLNDSEYKIAFDMIKAAKTVAIVGHVRPDGDCVGSSLALKMALEGMNKKVAVYIDDDLNKKFPYINGFDQIITKLEGRKPVDLLIILDSSMEDRIGIFTGLREGAKKVLCIDHHLDTNIKADFTICLPDRASTGEILYEFFTQNKIEITSNMATALYTSVSTDTGCFLYPNTTALSHRVAAELIEIGVDVELVNYDNFRVYDSTFLVGFKQVLRNLRFANDGKISYTYLNYKINKKYHFDFEERHKLKQYASDVRGVLVSIFMTEENRNVFHVSLRSHGAINVAGVAKTFGGGGHKNASGFTICGRYNSVIKRILPELGKIL